MSAQSVGPLAPATTAPSRVLLLIDDLDCGGAQQMVVSLALELHRRAIPCLVCALHPEASLGPRLQGSGVPFFSLNRPRPSITEPGRFLGYVLGCLKDLRACIRREGITVVHAHLSDAEFLGILASRLCGVAKVVVTVHSQRPLPERRAFDPRTTLRIWLTRLLFNRASAVVAVSEETAAILRDVFGVRRDKLHVIINGIDTAAADQASAVASAIPPGRPVLCTVGRLAAQKNQAVFLPVLTELLARGLSPVLVVAGDGELRSALEAARDAVGLTGRMLFLGQRDDVAAVIAASDVFVLPSLYEGTSLALLEAMAAGKPIVASDVPGNRDILRDGETALLCPPDAPDVLAGAIARLVAEPALAAALGAAARAEAREKYDISGMTDAYLTLWNAPGR